MEKINLSILIDAPKEKVWHTMLDDKTYRQWTEAFNKGSYYEGNWEKGSDIKFLGPDEKGELGGMFSRIEENRPYEYISILHRGVIKGDTVDTESEEVKKWAGAHENYSFKEVDGKTEVTVDMDITPEYKEQFNAMWKEAFDRLKELAEK